MDIAALATNNGLAFAISIVTVVAIASMFRTAWKHTPQILKSAKEFLDSQYRLSEAIKSSAQAMEESSKAVMDNTQVTIKSYEQSEMVVTELKTVSHKFERHDANALELRQCVLELIELVKENNNSEEVMATLKELVEQINDLSIWDGEERRKDE